MIHKSSLEAILYSLMVGATESFALFYAVSRKLPVDQLALLSTLPLMIGSLGQWLVPWLCSDRNLRALKLASFAVQCAGLGLLCVATQRENFYPWIFSALCLYWLGGMTAAPLWLEWIGGKVPPSVFRGFLSKRNAMVSGVTLVGYLACAVFLNRTLSSADFFAVFALACVARVASTLLQAAISRDPAVPFSEKRHSRLEISPAHQKRALLALFAGCFLFKVAVNISSPFFLPYMVQDLQFSLLTYTAVTAVPFLGRFLFLANWGRAAFGSRPVLGIQIAAFGISLSPLLWTFFSRPQEIAVLELMSGILWGGFELCTTLALQSFCRGKPIRTVGAFLALSNVGALVGSLIGAQLFKWLGSYHALFLASAVARVGVAFSLVFLFARIQDLRFRARHYGEFLATALSPRPSLANVGRILFIRERVRRLPLRAARTLRDSSIQWLKGLNMGPEAVAPEIDKTPDGPRNRAPENRR